MPGRVDAVLQRGGSRIQQRLVVVLGVVAVALAVASFLGPWWVVSTQGSLLAILQFNITSEFRPLGATTTTQDTWACCNPNTTTAVTIDYHNRSSTGLVFTVASWAAAFGVLSGVGMTVMAAVSGSSFSSRRLGPILGLLAFLLVLTALLSVMLQLPGAASQDGIVDSPVAGFWGSFTAYGTHSVAVVTYGAGWAWYAALVAALLFLIGSIALIRARATSPLQTPPQTAQGP